MLRRQLYWSTGVSRTDDGTPYPVAHVHLVPPTSETTTAVSEGAEGYHVHSIDNDSAQRTTTEHGHWHALAKEDPDG